MSLQTLVSSRQSGVNECGNESDLQTLIVTVFSCGNRIRFSPFGVGDWRFSPACPQAFGTL